MQSRVIQLTDRQAHALFSKGSLDNVIAFYMTYGNNFLLPCNKNPLHYAAHNKEHPIVIFYLLRYRGFDLKVNDIDDFDNHALSVAAYSENMQGIEYLIYYGADYTKVFKFGETLEGMLMCKMKGDYIPRLHQIIEAYLSGKPLPFEDNLTLEIYDTNLKYTPKRTTPESSHIIRYWMSGLFRVCFQEPASQQLAPINLHTQEYASLLSKKRQ